LLCAITIALLTAMVAAVASAPAPAAADPAPTIAEVTAAVDALHRQAEQASERYNAAGERASAAEVRLREVQAQLEARRGELAALRGVVGKIAAATYRSGAVNPGMLLVFSERPEDFFYQATALARISARQNSALRRLAELQRQQDLDRVEAQAQATRLADARDVLERERLVIGARLADAEAVLSRLQAEERARMEAEERAGQERAAAAAQAQSERVRRSAAASRSGSGGGGAADPATGRVPTGSGGAARAVDMAFAQLGKPYRYGATGPGSYDCSGLTGFVWRAAGVGLPRTSGAQYAAGRKVSRGGLQPGDLVYFYSPISHVGIYIGSGQIIHAARPGHPVVVAPVASMPFAGATRP
jgi:cell wall-associated NlpC family hydrolase